MNPVALAMIDYLVGPSSALSIMTALLKGPGSKALPLHIDSGTTPTPLPPYAQTRNVTWLLTDYSRENGALCFVPGSHRWARHPTGDEAADLSLAIPAEAERGSMVIWGGNTWHGAFPRTTQGIRVAIASTFNRYHVRPWEPYKESVTREMLDRNPARFATLMGQNVAYGEAREEGPDPRKVAMRPRGGWFD